MLLDLGSGLLFANFRVSGNFRITVKTTANMGFMVTVLGLEAELKLGLNLMFG